MQLFFVSLLWFILQGSYCEKTCSANVCLNGGTCMVDDQLKNFRCICKKGFSSSLCEIPCSLECGNGVCTIDSTNNERCLCNEGYHGPSCENQSPNDSNEPCELDSDCPEGSRCVGSEDRGICLVDPCLSQPCLHNSTCKTDGKDFVCECPLGYAGHLCESDINECELQPCSNGGTCVNTAGSFECHCAGKFRGRLCEEDIGFCISNPCLNNGTCVESATTFHCLCSKGWTGETCEQTPPSFDPCAASPCQNQGRCEMVGNNFTCICVPPFVGKTCNALEECLVEGKPCQNNGLCLRGLVLNSCQCDANWNGKWCETAVQGKFPDVCENVTCYNGGSCDPSQGTCNCDESHSGEFCQLNGTSTSGAGTSMQQAVQCSDCEHSSRCVDLESRVLCICENEYTGTTCSLQNKLCENSACEGNGKCFAKRLLNATSVVECGCPIGKGGRDCSEDSSVSFTSDSLFVYQSPLVMIGSSSATLPYSLKVSFRTTVPNVHIVSGENIFGQKLLTVMLQNGRLAVNVTGTSFTNLLPISISDGSWYTLDVQKLQKDLAIHLEEGNGYELLRSELPRSAQFDVFTTRIGRVSEQHSFTGCLADLEIEGTQVDIYGKSRAVSVKKGCQRSKQCTPNKCANGGLCVDLWQSHVCHCKPPFLPPSCLFALEPSTFGHDELPSSAVFSIDTENSHGLLEKTDIQFVARTNMPNGVILFVGDKSQDDVGTFISTQLINGTVNVRTRTGGKSVADLSSRTRVDDNNNHVIRIERLHRHIKLLVDDNLEGETDIPVRFDHPLFAEQVILGNTEHANPDAFTTDKHFKGMLQDVQLNGGSLVLNSSPDLQVTAVGTLESKKNVLKGLVSDDVCTNTSPCVYGRCINTFNDYECVCKKGWMGRDCERKDYCALRPCTNEARCTNSRDGFICTSPTTLVNSSYMVFNLDLPPGTAQTILSNITLDIKTFDTGGSILNLSSPSYSLSLNGGRLQLQSSGRKHVVNVPLNDGQWKRILISGNVVDINGNKYGIPEFVRFGSSTTVAQLTVGAVDDDRTFSGAIDNVTIGEALPLSFYRPEEAGETGDQLKFVAKTWNKIHRSLIVTEVCKVNPCKNNGYCVESYDTFSCNCPKGFSGHYCEANIDECVGASCGHGYCLDGLSDYRCICDKSFGGQACDAIVDFCAEKPCRNGALCENANSSYYCECKDGWMGQNCDVISSKLCSDNPCRNGGRCQQQADGFVCRCQPEFFGILCEETKSPCQEHPCKHGLCIDIKGDFVCECEPGFTGTRCDVLLDVCSELTPCVHGRCENIWNGTLCHCDSGWQGGDCSVDVNECMNIPCENDAVCENTESGYSCSCRNYYLGDRCEVAGSCLSNPCIHGDCIQLRHDEHKCTCHKGYEGSTCELRIDYCKNKPCVNGATCENLIGEFKCHCISGFSGEHCEEDINECASNPCKNGGKCRDRVADFECSCEETGYSGRNCTIDIDECSIASSCVHGTCVNLPGSYRCQCEKGFIGARCAARDPCIPDANNRSMHTCVHGDCVNPVVKIDHGHELTYHECQCFRGFTGTHCSMQVPEKRVSIGYVLGPLVAILLVLCLLGCALFVFVMRGKRATHGHYSPSNQEISGARMQMNSMIKLPPEERLI